MRGIVIGMLVSVLAVFTAGSVAADCVSGTVTAQIQMSGPFAGLYKYTIDFAWDTPQGLSNVTLDCGFGDCPEQACTHLWLFDTPAGMTDGVPDPCTVNYAGEFNCEGNPSIGVTNPIIKWDALSDSTGCEPGNTGSGTLCFYTDVPPREESSNPVFIIKDGQNVCNGMLMGDCPSACTVPTEEITWGQIKAIFAPVPAEDVR